jgi:hypothetical protein
VSLYAFNEFEFFIFLFKKIRIKIGPLWFLDNCFHYLETYFLETMRNLESWQILVALVREWKTERRIENIILVIPENGYFPETVLVDF